MLGAFLKGEKNDYEQKKKKKKKRVKEEGARLFM
jgi:hypothetical protein